MPGSRFYGHGKVLAQDFAPDEACRYLTGPGLVWIHLTESDLDELKPLGRRLGLHELALEDATSEGPQRTKLDRYPNHLFLSAHLVTFDADAARLRTDEIVAFATRKALITVSKDDGSVAEALVARWDQASGRAHNGMCFLLHGLFDLVADSHLSAARSLDEQIEMLRDELFRPRSGRTGNELDTFMLRKALIELRHAALPMREVLENFRREDDLGLLTAPIAPYLQDVVDHVLQTIALVDGLRDVATNILETTLAIQNNRLGLVTKRVTGYAAMVAVPTAVTGFFGQNIPYPGFGSAVGFYTSTALLVGLTALLWITFKLRDWL